MSSRSGENIPVIPHTSRHNRSRKSHGKVLAPLADSSEDEPSSHSSIYEATLASDSETEGIGSPSGKRGSDFLTVGRRDVGIDNTTEDEDAGQEHGLSSTGETNAVAMTGSELSGSADNRRTSRQSPGLETIVEQQSKNTLREEHSAFPRFDRRSSSEFSEDADDDDESHLLPRGRRKKARTQSSRSDYFDYYTAEQVYDYASPSQPLYQSISTLNNAESPLSPATPPLGGTPPISASFFNRNYSPSSPIRTPLQGPTFRPPVSGYRSYGTLTNHPFHNAPMARSDRGEGSSRTGGNIGYSATGSSTPDSLGSGARSRAGSTADGSRGGAMEKWKLWKLCGIFCCLGRREED